MRVLIDASVCSKGGAVQVVLALLNNILYDDYFEVISVVSPEIDSQIPLEQKNRALAYHVEKNENVLNKHKQGKRLLAIEKLSKPDLVFVVFGPSYWRPVAACLQGFALPLLVYSDVRDTVYKDDFKARTYQKLLNIYKSYIFKKNSDFAVVETNTFKVKLSEVVGFDQSNIYVVENSFNKNFTSDLDVKMILNESFNIFIPSAYYPHKNLEILIDVAKILKFTFELNFKMNFLIPLHSKEWKEMVFEARAKSVEENIFSYGKVSNYEIKSLYNDNDFVLLPTLAEASTAVYPEAFISRKVLLTSNLDFARELCGNAAIYFDPLDAYDIAQKITNIVDDLDYQSELISKGTERLNSNYLTPDDKWFKQKEMLLDIEKKI